MKLASFEIIEEIEILGDASEQESITEIYELVDVTYEEAQAWLKIEKEIRKLNIWVESYSCRQFRNFGMYDLTIRIEHVEGFNIQDHFNKQFRLEQ